MGQKAGQLCSFALIAIVLMPLGVFALSALLSLPLWGLECNDAYESATKALSSNSTSGEGGGEPTINPALLNAYPFDLSTGDSVTLEVMCSYYEWFLYVNGNLIGIQLTLVAPIAGHGALLLLDLLISTWSLSLAGIAIGLVGGLSAVTAVVDTVNEKADVVGISKNKQMLKDLENGVVLDLERFIKDLRKSGTGDGKSDAELKEIFDQMDADGDGTLTREEIDKYEQTVKREVRRPRPTSIHCASSWPDCRSR
jgi:hypothetical protein